MPVTNHGRFRPLFGALCAFCTTLAGCQNQGPVVSQGDSLHAGPLFHAAFYESLRDRVAQIGSSPPATTPTATAPMTVARTPQPAMTGVSLVKPVSARVGADPGTVSSWQPVHRVGPENGPSPLPQVQPIAPAVPASAPLVVPSQPAPAPGTPQPIPTSTFVPASPVPTGPGGSSGPGLTPTSYRNTQSPGMLTVSPQTAAEMPSTTVVARHVSVGECDRKVVPVSHMVSKKGPQPGIPGVPREFEKQSLPTYVIEPPDQLIIQSPDGLKDQPIAGVHLVRPDGTVNLGIYGDVYLAGLTMDMARAAITAQVKKRVADFTDKNLVVDVYAYNSKVYYIITDGGGYGAQLYRLPVTGNETVLDALSQIYGLPPVASTKKIWIARATPGDGEHPKVLPVDWCGITQYGLASTNYQVIPGDRIFVQSDPWIRLDTAINKRLAPVDRILGTTLLGSTTVNSIKSRSSSGGSGGGTP
jgi:polysaccharide export outer membrane protein